MLTGYETEYLAEKFNETFGVRSGLTFFSVPGRVELGGNHTDHQRGRVLAAAIDLDTQAAAIRRDDAVIRICSEGYDPFRLDLENIACAKNSPGTPLSVTAGMADAFLANGFGVGGFDAYIRSAVPAGEGLSSSAAFEILIGLIFNVLYNGGRVNASELARFGQYSENKYFGKPSGLMDQLACALGSVNEIDFLSPDAPKVRKIDFDFEKSGYALCIVRSGKDHAGLTGDYASIPEEMRAVASVFGKEYLRQVPETDFFQALPEVRAAAGDRAVLRSMHFYEENRRVEQQAQALRDGRIDEFLRLVRESGRSSWMYLQNVTSDKNPGFQALGLTLALCEHYLYGAGASRVHGGGFAGSALAFVPLATLARFIRDVDAALGEGSCICLRVRNDGARWVSN